MADPKPDTKKEEQHSSKQGAEPAKTVLPDDMAYPTPELDPNTGAPLDTRFQGSTSQEATAQQQSPKSGSAAGAQTAQAKGKNDEDEDDEDDDSDKTKTKEKPKGRR